MALAAPVAPPSARELSPKERLAQQPRVLQERIIGKLDDGELERLPWSWEGWNARPGQCEPEGDWSTWLVLAGRGFGKSRAGAEWVRKQVEVGKAKRIALVGRTVADVREVMIEGESGLLAISPSWNMPTWEPSKRRLTWPNGSIATSYSADKPDQLRGPQHDAAWCDELAAWPSFDAWDQLQFGLRLGANPRQIVTTTPRPLKVIRDLMGRGTTHVTRGSTYDNLHNLAPTFAEQIINRYEGTRLGRQELYAEILDDFPGALWTRSTFEADGFYCEVPPDRLRIVVAVDPAISSNDESNETGIVVCARGQDKRGYVLADISKVGTPDQWARAAVLAYHEFAADKIVYETNQGGEMVAGTIKTVDPTIPLKAVRASRGKIARAEPVAALYEQGKISHCGIFHQLEDQMCTYTADTRESPDRLDALVWGMSEVMLRGGGLRAA